MRISHHENQEKTKELFLGYICGAGFSLERSNTHVYSPKKEAHNRPRYRYKKRPTWWTNELYWGYLQDMGEGLLTEAEVTQNSCVPTARPRIHDCSQKPGTWITLHIACREINGGYIFPNDSAGLNLFQVSSSRKVVFLRERSSANFTAYN